jgi:hypothetical protein
MLPMKKTSRRAPRNVRFARTRWLARPSAEPSRACRNVSETRGRHLSSIHSVLPRGILRIAGAASKNSASSGMLRRSSSGCSGRFARRRAVRACRGLAIEESGDETGSTRSSQTACPPPAPLPGRCLQRRTVAVAFAHQTPVFAIDAQGSCGGNDGPCCSSSMEMRSGERTKAMWPSRGGRLMVTPIACRRAQVA